MNSPHLRPSPLQIGDVFSAAFGIFKQKFGLFVLMALMPSIVTMVLGFALAALFIFGAADSGYSNRISPALIGAIALAIIGYVFILLVQLKMQGMSSLAAFETAQGYNPDFKGLMERTRGYLPRLVVFIVLATLAVLVIGGVFGALVFSVASTTSSSSSSSESIGAVMILLMVLLVIGGIVLSVYLTVKWLYFLPTMAVERLDGISAIKRSMELTKGNFWRTFGYYILMALVIWVISYIVQTISQVVMLPFVSSMDRYDDNPGAILSAMIPLYLIVTLLQVVVSALLQPLQLIYITIMYIDQVRRGELAASAYNYYPGQPRYGQEPTGYGYSADPSAGYGQTGQYGQPQSQGTPYGQPQSQGTQYGQPTPNPYDQQQPGPYGQPQSQGTQYGQPTPNPYDPQQPQQPDPYNPNGQTGQYGNDPNRPW